MIGCLGRRDQAGRSLKYRIGMHDTLYRTSLLFVLYKTNQVDKSNDKSTVKHIGSKWVSCMAQTKVSQGLGTSKALSQTDNEEPVNSIVTFIFWHRFPRRLTHRARNAALVFKPLMLRNLMHDVDACSTTKRLGRRLYLKMISNSQNQHDNTNSSATEMAISKDASWYCGWYEAENNSVSMSFKRLSSFALATMYYCHVGIRQDDHVKQTFISRVDS